MSVTDIALQVDRIHDSTARYLPHIVHCPYCGRTANVDPAQYLRFGRPKCCSQPMLLGQPPAVRSTQLL